MAKAKPLDPSHALLLQRLEALGVSDAEAERSAGLTQAWIAKSRKGVFTASAPGWEKLRAYLDAKKPIPGVVEMAPAGVAEMQARALEILAEAAAKNDDNVSRLAAALGSTPARVREILARPVPRFKQIYGSSPHAPQPPPDPEKVAGLLEAVRKAKTHRRIGLALEALGLEVLLGTVDSRTAERLESTLKARQRSLREERLERGMAKVSALRVLLPDEVELLERRRAAVATPPLAPGEKPAPPDEAPERVVTTCPTCNGSSVLVEVRPRAPSPPAAAP